MLFVGGAGTLLQHAGGPLQIESPHFPKEYEGEARAHVEALDYLRSLSPDDGLRWSSLTPPPMISPGERTGNFALGDDVLLGFSVSAEDYAVAAIDELEAPKHEQARFVVAHQTPAAA